MSSVDFRKEVINEEQINILLDKKGERSGFIVTRNQLNHLADVLKPCAEADCGLWSFTLYPKSGHLTHSLGNFVYPVRGLTKFRYFKWTFNRNFVKDLIYFRNVISNTDCDFILFYIKRESPMGDYIYAYDNYTNMGYKLRSFVGGGRLYHEPSAKPYKIYNNIIVIE
jgi:hypothetical protein